MYQRLGSTVNAVGHTHSRNTQIEKPKRLNCHQTHSAAYRKRPVAAQFLVGWIYSMGSQGNGCMNSETCSV